VYNVVSIVILQLEIKEKEKIMKTPKDNQKVLFGHIRRFLEDVLVSPEEFLEFLKERDITLEGSFEDDTDEQFEDLVSEEKRPMKVLHLRTA